MKQIADYQFSIEKQLRIMGRIIGIKETNYPLFQLLDFLELNGLLNMEFVGELKNFFATYSRFGSIDTLTESQLHQLKHDTNYFAIELENEIIHYS